MFEYKIDENINFDNSVESILISKGVEDTDFFLKPTIKYNESVKSFQHMREAVDLFMMKLKEDRPRVGVVVDCDCDGYTSAAFMMSYLLRIQKEFKSDLVLQYYIHDRKIHGLEDVVNEIIDDKLDLLIVPDAATGNAKECNSLIDNGCQVIILDHHPIDPKDNKAIIINNQLEENIKDKAMTGVGIVYKFCRAVDNEIGCNWSNDYYDLIAVGMIGDKCDLFQNQSRYYVFRGLEEISKGISKNLFIKELIQSQSYSMSNKITVNGIAFYICPMINSLIRLGTREEKLLMFEAFCNSDKKLVRKVRGKGEVEMSIQEYVRRACEATNRKQKSITEESSEKLSEEIAEYGLNQYPILVVNAGEDVDSNSTGLIAGRLSSMYKKPCLLLRENNGVCKGSGRGYLKCELTDFKDWCKETGLFFGLDGHENAFGAQIFTDKTELLFDLLSRTPAFGDNIYTVCADYEAENFSGDIVKHIAKYNYVWGCSVDEPLFVIKGIPIKKSLIQNLGKTNNRIMFKYKNVSFVKFSRSSLLKEYKEISDLKTEVVEFDVVGVFDIYDGSAQVRIEDWNFRPSSKKVGFLI